MPYGFDHLDDAFNRHIVDKIEYLSEHDRQHEIDDHNNDPWFSIHWGDLASKFACHLAVDFISEYIGSVELPGQNTASSPHQIGHVSREIGSPNSDGFHHQTTGFTCAIVSQKMILDQFGVIDPQTGQPVSETLLAYEAQSHGWLSDHGMSVQDMGKSLELHGIPVHHGHTWNELIDDLKNGHQVSIAVNADELWQSNGLSTLLNQILPGHPNHAVVLKGLRIDENDHVSVVINDPGQPEGAGVEYSLTQFQAALGSGHFDFIATDIAPDGWHTKQWLNTQLDPFSFNRSETIRSNDYAERVTTLDDEDRLNFLRDI